MPCHAGIYFIPSVAAVADHQPQTVCREPVHHFSISIVQRAISVNSIVTDKSNMLCASRTIET